MCSRFGNMLIFFTHMTCLSQCSFATFSSSISLLMPGTTRLRRPTATPRVRTPRLLTVSAPRVSTSQCFPWAAFRVWCGLILGPTLFYSLMSALATYVVSPSWIYTAWLQHIPGLAQDPFVLVLFDQGARPLLVPFWRYWVITIVLGPIGAPTYCSTRVML